MTENTQNKKSCLLWAACLLALAAFGAAMIWLHYQQLCSPGGGSDPYTSDLGQHLAFAQRGTVSYTHLDVYKRQDKLFASDALDVSTDIDVMENMLRADGLTGDTPFKL